MVKLTHSAITKFCFMRLKVTGAREGGSFEQIYRMPNFRQ